MSRRGITLIEVLVSAVMLVLLLSAFSRAYMAAVQYPGRLRSTRDLELSRISFEEKLSDIIRRATLSNDPNDAASFFIGDQGQGTQQQQQPTTMSGNATTLTLTNSGQRVPGQVLNSTDDFETNNQNFGPQGGMKEIEISTTPVGQPTNNQTGLFIRQQIPADGDPTQGGYESVLNADISDIQFEFFDGTDWQPSWNTQTMGTQRLPAAVRVTYSLNGDDTQHVFIVRLPMSDVTTDNPVTQAGGQ